MTHREATMLIDHPVLRALTGGVNPGTSSPAGAPPTPLHWADLGCGAGTFTLALAEYLVPGSTIDAIDLSPTIRQQTTGNNVHIVPRAADFVTADFVAADFVTADFVTAGFGRAGLHPADFASRGSLDGILMANSLHYVDDQPRLLQRLHAVLKPGALLVLVEYDTDTAVSRWVPYPISFAKATRLFGPDRWSPLKKISQKKSAFGRSNLYSAFTTLPGA